MCRKSLCTCCFPTSLVWALGLALQLSAVLGPAALTMLCYCNGDRENKAANEERKTRLPMRRRKLQGTAHCILTSLLGSQ